MAKKLILYFKQQQGDAIEVAPCQQSLNERKNFSELARLHDLYASVGSDFHRPCTWTEIRQKSLATRRCAACLANVVMKIGIIV